MRLTSLPPCRENLQCSPHGVTPFWSYMERGSQITAGKTTWGQNTAWPAGEPVCFSQRTGGQAVAVVKRTLGLQPVAEYIGSRKLKVDSLSGRTYMFIIDICLLSFGFRAFSIAP